MNDIDGALDNLHRSLSLNNDQFYGWSLLGQLYLEKEQYNAAILAFKQAQVINPREQWIRQLIGQIELRPSDSGIKSQILFPEPDI